MPQRPTNARYYTIGWLTIAAALAYLCRNAVGVAESTIREEFDLTLQQSGWFMGAFFWTYALFQIPGGALAQHYGTRIILALFALIWSVATFCIGSATGFWLLIAAQLLMGMAQAGIFPASCNSIGHWMPFMQRSMACGILVAGMQVGAIMASGLTGPLIATLGWRWVFILFAIPGIVWAIGFLIHFRNSPNESTKVNDSELTLIQSDRNLVESAHNTHDNGATAWFMIARRPVIWLLCGQQICRSAGYMFFASWFPTFLQVTRGVSIEDSGYLQGLVLAGTLTGCLLGGMLTDWIWRRTRSLRFSRSGVGATFLGACALLIFGAWFVQSAFFATIFLVVGSLFAALASPCAFATAIDIGEDRVPQIFGLMNMCGNFSAAACPILIGQLFELTTNWNLVLLLFAAIYLIGAICWLFINPR